MIDLDKERLIPLISAAAHYPGTRPHRSTCFRHALRGVRGLRLETVIVGGKRYTSQEAIHRFVWANSSPPRVGSNETYPAELLVDSHLDAEGF